MGLEIKNTVDLSGIRPELVLAICVVRSLFYRVRVTSVADAHTGRVSGSLHNVGLAVDLVLPVGVSNAHDRISNALGPQFDVIVEDDHVHIEFQPE